MFSVALFFLVSFGILGSLKLIGYAGLVQKDFHSAAMRAEKDVSLRVAFHVGNLSPVFGKQERLCTELILKVADLWGFGKRTYGKGRKPNEQIQMLHGFYLIWCNEFYMFENQLMVQTDVTGTCCLHMQIYVFAFYKIHRMHSLAFSPIFSYIYMP
jgi:hypothetical protein